MTEANTLADGRGCEALDIVGSLGLAYHYKLPPFAQSIVNDAATGSSTALADYAAMLLELSALNGLAEKETCALIEPVAYLAAVNGGPDGQLFLARIVRRLGDALRNEPAPLSPAEESRKVSSWWQAVAIYEQLARSGHEAARSELADLLHQLEGEGLPDAAEAARRMQAAGLMGNEGAE